MEQIQRTTISAALRHTYKLVTCMQCCPANCNAGRAAVNAECNLDKGGQEATDVARSQFICLYILQTLLLASQNAKLSHVLNSLGHHQIEYLLCLSLWSNRPYHDLAAYR